MDILHNAAFWIVVAAVSELIGMSPKLKANSIIQMVLQILELLRPKSAERNRRNCNPSCHTTGAV